MTDRIAKERETLIRALVADVVGDSSKGGAVADVLVRKFREWCQGDLRDWFAGQAPTAPDWWLDLERGKDKRRAHDNDRYHMRDGLTLQASYAYAYADAMLAQRDTSHE